MMYAFNDYEISRAIRNGCKSLLCTAGFVALAVFLNAFWLLSGWILLSTMIAASWTKLASRNRTWSDRQYICQLAYRWVVVAISLPAAPFHLLRKWKAHG